MRSLEELGFWDEAKLSSLTLEERQQVETVIKLLDSITLELYFASGAHDQKKGFPSAASSDDKRAFLQGLDSQVRELARIGLAQTSHHLLEMLEYLADADPPGVFIRMGQIVRNTERQGYQHEPLGLELVVRITERYLADYRSYLRERVECRDALIDVLDIFVRAGWERALLLAFRVNEIYR